MKPPAIDNAVQTTPPITIAPTMPLSPFMPTATKITEAIISVISVMPLTGLLPTIAIALAATVVKRKAITVTTKKATSACQKLCNTPTQKNTSVQSNATAIASTKNFMLRSRSVRSEACATALPLPPNSLPARPTADFITPQLFTIPIMPAIAIAPIPMLRPYCVNITCGSTASIPGTLPNNGSNTHHTKNEPAQITAAYFSPMI